MNRHTSNFVLAYQNAEDVRREEKDRFLANVAGVLAYSVVWAAVGALVVALLGSVVLWGALLASATQ